MSDFLEKFLYNIITGIKKIFSPFFKVPILGHS